MLSYKSKLVNFLECETLAGEILTMKDYDVYFEESSGAVNHKILSAHCVDDVIAYMRDVEPTSSIVSITPRT